MPQWMQDLVIGWPMIRSNLPTFFVILVLITGAVWLVMNWSYSAVLGSKNAQIELQDRQLADYRNKLGGATPTEAKAEIDALKEKIRHTIGDKWTPLTAAEITVLKEKLTALPKKIRVQIMYENYLGKDLAQSFYDAFKQAGWTGAVLSTGSGLGYGVTTGQGSGIAPQLKKVIEESSKIEVEVLRPDQPEWGDLVFLAVGINSK